MQRKDGAFSSKEKTKLATAFREGLTSLQETEPGIDINISLDKYLRSGRKSDLLFLFEAFRVGMCKNRKLILPYEAASNGTKKYGTITRDDKKYLVVFSDKKQAHGSKTIAKVDALDLFELVLLSNAAGIMINPSVSRQATLRQNVTSQQKGSGVVLTKKNILQILKSYYNDLYRCEIVEGNIEELDVDVIVNSTDMELSDISEVSNAIHRKAGKEMALACADSAPCAIGDVRVTNGGKLLAKYVVHVVGPWPDMLNSDRLLSSCYSKAIYEAIKLGAHSIAFPAIATGGKNFSKEAASMIAIETVQDCLKDNRNYPLHVVFVCHNDEMKQIYKKIIREE